MPDAEFKAGDIVTGLEPDEHVEIRRVAPFGNKTLIEGITVVSCREIRRPLGQEELARLTKVRGSVYTSQPFIFNRPYGTSDLGVSHFSSQLNDMGIRGYS